MTTSEDNRGSRTLVPRYFLLFIVIVVALLPLVLNRQEAKAPLLFELDGPTMGTTYSVRFDTVPEGVTTEALGQTIDATLARINTLMSTYDPESELSRFNRHEGREWFDMSAETVTVIDAAMKISEMTSGAFDVTIGPLVDLWGFGSTTEVEFEPPSAAEIQKVRGRIGFRHLEVRQDPPALRRTRVGLQVDLSGIAKGYAVDQIADDLETAGVESYMIEIGGEIRTRGHKPDGSPWLLGIEAPLRGQRVVHRVVELENDAMATSGDYRNYLTVKGKVFSHLLDPRTGHPIKHRLASATIIADKCTSADALATALMVLGPEEGYQVALGHDLAVLWLLRQGGTNGAPDADSATGGERVGLAESHPLGEERFIEKTSPAFERRKRSGKSTEGSSE